MPPQTPDTTSIPLDDAEPPKLLTNCKTCRQEIPLHCTGLVDLLARFTPVQDSVLCYLNIRDIVALSRTTKALSGCVGIVERTQFDVNERLKRFFEDPKAFRSLQAKHNIVIGGTFALGFMSRDHLNTSSQEVDACVLDELLVQQGAHAQALQSFLVSEGYKLTGTSPIPNHLIMVRTNSKGLRRVAIVELETPPFSRIRNAAFTSDVNFITWNKAYSVFAYQTFILQEGYLLKHVADIAADRTLKVWDNIGISIAPVNFQDALHLDASTDPGASGPRSKMMRKRLIGDRHSWVIHLDTHGIEPPPFQDHSFDYAGFEVTTSIRNTIFLPSPGPFPPFDHYTIKMTVLKSRVLRHQYAFADRARAEHCYFRDRAVMQLFALASEQRPPGFAQTFALRQHIDLSDIGDFVPPAGWIYHDDDMLKMLEVKYPGAVRVIERKD